MANLRTAITYGIFPVTFIGMMVLAVVSTGRGLPMPYALGGVTVLTVIIVAICERINPHIEVWNKPQNDVKTDLLHGAVSMVMLPQVLEIGLKAVLIGVAVKLTQTSGFSLWPHHWHIALQLILAMLISQFGEYWAHRLLHTVPFLWRFHATHHSPGRLYWLNAARFHPVDAGGLFIISNTPLLLLGANESVLLLLLVWIAVHGLFQHCNIKLRLGPLNYIFSMAELHRWHHSLKLEEANSNYGNNIIFWDIVFGTMFYPKDREASEHIGLSDLKDFPQDYLGQVASPFKWEKYQRS